jgi:hypothetical protein
MLRDRRRLEREGGIGCPKDSPAINGRDVKRRCGPCENNRLDCERKTTEQGATRTQAGFNSDDISQMNIGRLEFFETESIPISRDVVAIETLRMVNACALIPSIIDSF